VLIKILFLALAWSAMTGDLDPLNLLFGAVVGYSILWTTGRTEPLRPSSLRKAPQAVSLAVFFVWQLVIANLRMARAVLGRVDQLHPAIIAVPLDVTSDAEITMLANLITLTPGTLSIDVSSDRRVLYVHVADCPDPDEARRELKEGFEHRVREVYG
jgi:multicomponent Na+:H+ antiporter subunit E